MLFSSFVYMFHIDVSDGTGARACHWPFLANRGYIRERERQRLVKKKCEQPGRQREERERQRGRERTETRDGCCGGCVF